MQYATPTRNKGGDIMRGVGNRDEFTPLGLFMREHCRDVGLTITNIDYMVHDYQRNRVMLIEEKRRGAKLGYGQSKTLQFLDELITRGVRLMRQPVEYWGIYVLQFPEGKHFPGPGMLLNNIPITVEQYVEHVNFNIKHCDGLTPQTMPQLTMSFPSYVGV
jgi:hypothetical protein